MFRRKKLKTARGRITEIGPLTQGIKDPNRWYRQWFLAFANGAHGYTYVDDQNGNHLIWANLLPLYEEYKLQGKDLWLDGLGIKDEKPNGEIVIDADYEPTIYTPPESDPIEQEKERATEEFLAGQAPAETPAETTASSRRQVKEAQLYPPQFAGCEPPKELWTNKYFGKEVHLTIDGKETYEGELHIAGSGRSATAQVLFINNCILREETQTNFISKPKSLNGPAGNLFLRSLLEVGFQEHEWFYTALVKYNVPKLKIKGPDIRWCQAIIEDEINTIKPKIIVCLGKDTFDFLWSQSEGKQRKFALKDVQGGFFTSEKYGALLYPMDTVLMPLMKPEYLERFIVDLTQVRRTLDDIQGINSRIRIEQKYVVIDNVETLANVTLPLAVNPPPMLAVDCEWHGQTAYGGNLRSFQFSWKAGHAAYLKLMDDKQKYCFSHPIEVVRNVLKPAFHNPLLKFVGHNASADMPWMNKCLGIPVYRRFIFDTMYAQHTIDEYADLKLERCAVKYTDLGRYDIPLALWKKDNKFDDDNEPGYGRVPDRIIIPYGLRDVDATIRCVSHLMRKLIQQGLYGYYTSFLLPFVTDGFYEMMDSGLPINEAHLEEMREVFTRNQELLLQHFRGDVRTEAMRKLHRALLTVDGIDKVESNKKFFEIVREMQTATDDFKNLLNLNDPGIRQVVDKTKSLVGAKSLDYILPIMMHCLESGQFNINSTDQMKRWLFDVKGLTPLKTTKKDGVQLAWAKAMAQSRDKQREYQPAADKQTIKVYADKDPLVAQLQELKSVGNIVKAFLKGPDEEGREQGIPKWIQPDGRIHANFALTETARPRAWKPNILNWPKAVTKPIEAAFERIQRAYPAHAEKPNTLRSVVQAPEGWVIVDMDLKTAEVVALAYQAGDENMIKVLTEPDAQFACIDRVNPKKVVRIAFNENSSYPDSEWDKSLLVPVDDPRILRKEDGSVLHPKRDLHWEIGETVVGKPREHCDERMHRDGCGKVGNFSIPYGATGTLLERLIEVNTGKKPEEGTGSRMIEAYNTRYPQAAQFLKDMEMIVENPGRWRSLSGRLRHFWLVELSDIEQMRRDTVNGILSPLTRQARNFPMQELVSATTAKALLMFIEKRREMGLDARIGLLLYDAMTAFAPLEQAKATADLLKKCLVDWVSWTVKGRTFNFEVDTSFYFRWGAKMTKEEKEKLAPYLQ